MRTSDNCEDSWGRAQRNASYWHGALSDEIGGKIKWHSPDDERSSQVFCISAFGGLSSLPDCDTILNELFADLFGNKSPLGPWTLFPEHTNRALLGEYGYGTTNVDVFCESSQAVVCVESKLWFDAKEGFGGCGQITQGHCAGFYGPGSDRKTNTKTNCRLEVQDGNRSPRKYWELGRKYFTSNVFREQKNGDDCPFAYSNFQLMRNFLFAASSAKHEQSFGVVAIAPEKSGATILQQLEAFKSDVLSTEYRDRVHFTTYDKLTNILSKSPHESSRKLGVFLQERLTKLVDMPTAT